MSDTLLDSESWKDEAAAVLRDITSHVSSCCIANLPSHNDLIYLNVTTLEQQAFCIELSGSGFRVADSAHNSKAHPHNDYFETPYSLLSSLSPAFVESFGNCLINKLNQLQQQ